MLKFLGFYAQAGFESDYELISTTVLGSDTASVTFSSLGTYSSDYKHLQIRYSARSARTVSITTTVLRFNGDTGSNYRSHNLFGQSTGVFSADVPQTYLLSGLTPANSATASSFSGAVVDILDPYSTSKNTTIRVLSGDSTGIVALTSGLWIDTSSITSITFLDEAGANLKTDSRFSLYGIKG